MRIERLDNLLELQRAALASSEPHLLTVPVARPLDVGHLEVGEELSATRDVEGGVRGREEGERKGGGGRRWRHGGGARLGERGRAVRGREGGWGGGGDGRPRGVEYLLILRMNYSLRGGFMRFIVVPRRR